MTHKIPKGKKLILFDGVCNLCNSSVNKIIKLDKKNHFLFASLQSEIGNEIIEYLNIDPQKIDSIVLYTPGISYEVKSTAVLKIASDFGKMWKFFSSIFLFIPTGIRDFIYNVVSKNRYKWFGKRESCMIPTPELKARFLD